LAPDSETPPHQGGQTEGSLAVRPLAVSLMEAGLVRFSRDTLGRQLERKELIARKAIGSPLSGPCPGELRKGLKHVQTAQNRSYEALKHGAKWMKTERVMILYDTLMLYKA
jgi:hypothetical protein